MDVDPIPLAKGRRKSSGGLSGRKGLFGSFKSPRDKSALDAIGEAEADDAVGSRESVGEKVKKLFKSPRGNRSSDILSNSNSDLPPLVFSQLGENTPGSREQSPKGNSVPGSPSKSPYGSPRSPGSPRLELLGREPQGAVAPQLKSERRHQVVEVADLHRWNRDKSHSSLPVGLVGLVEEESIPSLFEDASFVEHHRKVEKLLDRQRLLIESSSERDLDQMRAIDKGELVEETLDQQSVQLQVVGALEKELERFERKCRHQIEEEKRKTARLHVELERSQKELEQVQRLLAEAQAKLKVHLCSSCREEEVDHVVIPCGHACLCSGCICYQDVCPECKGEVHAIQEIKFM